MGLVILGQAPSEPHREFRGCNSAYHFTHHFMSLRKSRDLPFPSSAQLSAAFGSLSSLEHIQSKVMCAWRTQGTTLE